MLRIPTPRRQRWSLTFSPVIYTSCYCHPTENHRSIDLITDEGAGGKEQCVPLENKPCSRWAPPPSPLSSSFRWVLLLLPFFFYQMSRWLFISLATLVGKPVFWWDEQKEIPLTWCDPGRPWPSLTWLLPSTAAWIPLLEPRILEWGDDLSPLTTKKHIIYL